MKKIITVIILLTNFYCFSQTSVKKEKFQIGLQYNYLANKDYTYNGMAGLNTRYKIISLNNINFNLGLNAYMLKSKIDNFSNIILVNPNITTEFTINGLDLKPYFGIGYDFYTSKLTTDPITDITESRVIKTNYNGFNINPGVRYYFKKNIFIDLNYNYISTQASDEYKGKSKYNLIGIGLGLRF